MEKKLSLINKLLQKAQTVQLIVCIVSPYHTKLNWAIRKRKELPPFLTMASVLTKEILSVTKLFAYFFYK